MMYVEPRSVDAGVIWQLEGTPSRRGRFKEEVKASSIGPVGLWDIKIARRWRAQRKVASGTRFIKLVFQETGKIEIEQAGHRAVIGPGRWFAYEVNRPFTIVNLEPATQIGLLISHTGLEHSCPGFAAHLLADYPTSQGASQLLHEFVSSLLKNVDQLHPVTAEDLGYIVMRLIHVAFLETDKLYPKAIRRDAMQARIKAFINRNIRDQTLSPRSIAAAMGCSVRYVHKSFSESGGTVMDYVFEVRLDRCRSELLNTELNKRTITEIALSWGFSNSAQFSRAFKARFGQQPSATRSAARLRPRYDPGSSDAQAVSLIRGNGK